MANRAATSRVRRIAVPIVSVLTAVWLAAQLAIGLGDHLKTWPVTAFTMFRTNPRQSVEPRLQARTRSGRVVTVVGADFGLTRRELTSYLSWNVASLGAGLPAHAQARQTLAKLATIWNRSHSRDPAVSIWLTREISRLPTGRVRLERAVARSAP
jgi:hypothetical protein